MEGGMDKALDEGRVARGRGDTELADPWWGDADRYLIFLWAI